MNGFLNAFDALNVALAAEGDQLVSLPVERVDEDPDNPRDAFDAAELAALTATVREKGVLQPIVVRPADGEGRYRIRFGARRYRAAVAAGCALIPALVRPGADTLVDRLVEQVVENDQRASLTTAQMARAVSRLLDTGLSQAEIGARLGRPKDRIAMLAAVRAMPDLLQALAPRLGARTLYELFQAWKADGPALETWLAGRDPATITQAQARALGRVGGSPSTSRPGARSPKAAALDIHVAVGGRLGALVLKPGPSPTLALVRFFGAEGVEPVAVAAVRLIAVGQDLPDPDPAPS